MTPSSDMGGELEKAKRLCLSLEIHYIHGDTLTCLGCNVLTAALLKAKAEAWEEGCQAAADTCGPYCDAKEAPVNPYTPRRTAK